jgi:hypothetical protein
LVDRTLAGKGHATGDASILKDPQVLPVPAFMVNRIGTDPNCMDVDKTAAGDQADNDSGLGSSIDFQSTRSSAHSAITLDSAITKSFSTIDSAHRQHGHGLSEHASEQIEKYIIKPILQQEALKDFHPLIKDVPRRIGAKNISNLRDLEKTLLFLAPDYSASPSSYLSFCQVSIRCLHTTVDHLSDRDQRLPTDRPYTNNYFIDLVEQIHRYAQLIAEAREKQAEGKELGEMDYSSNEKLTLKGGISRDGQPLELVREKDGKTFPITDSLPSGEMVTAGKRTLEEEDYVDDDGVSRSMARRRKSEIPGDVIHTCKECKKDFKRPCDLTKHEKTHSRPWKCPDERCRYHEQGWPTEKERDRHINDKHSSTPHQYNCLFQPCSYSSKRESNCKQHMEKAHGWNYVRSKSNGRKKAADSSSSLQMPSTPATPPSSLIQPLHTPITPFAPSPAVVPPHNFGPESYGLTPAMSHADFDEGRRASVTTAGTGMTFSSSRSPYQPTTSFEDAITPEDPPLNMFTDFTLFGESKPMHTPGVLGDGLFDFNAPSITSANDAVIVPEHPHLSPGGQADAMLYSPPTDDMQVDEGIGDGFDPTVGDFPLFENTTVPMNNPDWFGGQFNDPTLLGSVAADIDYFLNQYGEPTNYPSHSS